jgi:hypothetical protein
MNSHIQTGVVAAALALLALVSVIAVWRFAKSLIKAVFWLVVLILVAIAVVWFLAAGGFIPRSIGLVW